MDFLPLHIGFVVLHTSPLDEPGTKDAGGMNVVVLAQARELAQRGHLVELITRRSSAEQPAEHELTPGLRVHHLDAGPRELLAKGAHEALIPDFTAGLNELADREAAAGQPLDIIHAEHWFSGVAALPVALRLGIPMAQSFHSIAAPADTPLADGERAESPGRLAGEARLAREADAVIAVSEAEAATVRERLGGERIVVVPLGVDCVAFHPADDGAEAGDAGTEADANQRSNWGPGSRAEVLVAGRLHPLKGFDLALAAVAAIPAAARPVLRIVGAPPPDDDGYTKRLHAAAESLGIVSDEENEGPTGDEGHTRDEGPNGRRSAAVRFEGALHRDELADRLRHAALVLVPSHSETFGLIALEAAASGVPVIASDAGGLREAVLDGVTGTLIASRDPSVWAAEIQRLLGDETERHRLAMAARAHAVRHSWAVSTDRLVETYRAMLAR